MENNLLFINQKKDIIQEFLAAMEGKEGSLKIDTADNGLDAALLLNKKIYKVVVTGLNLPTYDGTKIVEYLNQNYPHTVCIVYTWRLEQVHLKLLINERRVFRIFQRPADYEQMYEAIMDGIVKFDKKEIDALEKKDLSRRLKEASLQAAEIRRTLKEHPKERSELAKFLWSLLNVYICDLRPDMLAKEKKMLVQFEKKLMLRFLGSREKHISSLEELTEDICSHFHRPEQRRIVKIGAENFPETVGEDFYVKPYFVIWMLLTRFAMMSQEYDVQVTLMLINQKRFRVRVEGTFPEETWGLVHMDQTARMITSVTQTVLECFSDRFTQSIGDERVVYYMEMQD